MVLSAENVSIGYSIGNRNVIVQDNLNFSLKRGELVALLGSNGIGKSTLLRTLCAFQRHKEGSIRLCGKDIGLYSAKERSKLLSVVLTDRNFSGIISVYDLVSLGRQPYTGVFGVLSDADRQKIVKAIADVGLAHKIDSLVSDLSDGERQRAMIAKALAQEAPVMLLDEPTAFLDVAGRFEIAELLRCLAVKHNRAVLFSTHDVEQALMFADRLWLLTPEGLCCGFTEDVVMSGAMTSLYKCDDLCFCAENGRYLKNITYSKRIFVEAEDNALMLWCRNVFSKIGFGVCGVADEALVCVKCLSSFEFLVSVGEEKHRYSSFEGMLSFIKNRFV